MRILPKLELLRIWKELAYERRHGALQCHDMFPEPVHVLGSGEAK